MSDTSNGDDDPGASTEASSDDVDTDAVAFAPIPAGESEEIWGSREHDDNSIYFTLPIDDAEDDA